MTTSSSKSLFFTFEGIDASGKSLQARKLADQLQEKGFDVLLVREPGGTPIAEQIRAILLDPRHSGMTPFTELYLYEAARAQIVSEVIQPALGEGKIVISDRYSDSTVAYQSYGRSLPLDFVNAANRYACNGVMPLRTYILDIPWDESIRRRENDRIEDDRMESEKELFFNNVRKAYQAIADQETTRVLLLDGTRGVDDLSEEIYRDAWRWLDIA